MLPAFSLLKLDSSLIRNMSSRAPENVVISAAVMLAHHLSMKVSAIGIEEPWQAATLRNHTCDTIQGYLIAQPMAAELLVPWLRQQRDGRSSAAPA